MHYAAFRHCLLLLIGMASCLAFAPSPAQAQMRMCGPGETPVAVYTSDPSAHVPLCPSNGGGAAAVPESHAAFAWHVDAADIWVDGDYTCPNNAGPAKALAACVRAMGEGCVSGGDHAAVVENSGDRARRSAQGWCKRSKAKPCTLQAQYHARRQGLFVHEFELAPAN
jgi:hypothetical protein